MQVPYSQCELVLQMQEKMKETSETINIMDDTKKLKKFPASKIWCIPLSNSGSPLILEQLMIRFSQDYQLTNSVTAGLFFGSFDKLKKKPRTRDKKNSKSYQISSSTKSSLSVCVGE